MRKDSVEHNSSLSEKVKDKKKFSLKRVIVALVLVFGVLSLLILINYVRVQLRSEQRAKEWEIEDRYHDITYRQAEELRELREQSPLSEEKVLRARKIINGELFALQSYETDSRYELLVKNEGDLLPNNLSYELGAMMGASPNDYWVDADKGELFFVQSLPESPNKFEYIFKVKFDPNYDEDDIFGTSVSEVELVQARKRNHVYESTWIVNFISSSNTLVLRTASGDGCGGRGLVYSLNLSSGLITELVETGSGCAEGERYGGMLGDQIILGSVEPVLNSDFPEREYNLLKEVYLLNPISLEKSILISGDVLEDYALSDQFNDLSHRENNADVSDVGKYVFFFPTSSALEDGELERSLYVLDQGSSSIIRYQ